jgi:aryl-alcohol dehydrogenase-like predicted oxidoreductase
MAQHSRRDFLKAGLGAAFLGGATRFPALAQRGSATDIVTLGKSNVKVSRLAFGTGTMSGRVQRELGQEGFTSLVRYAYDHGIRFFETAESYGQMHQMLGIALKGIPRDTYQLMTKLTTRPNAEPLAKVDELRKLANTDYFDVALMHYQRVATWPQDTVKWQDGILEAKSKKWIVGHGASVHGLPALRQFPGNKWLEIALMRTNHKGVKMDAEDFNTQGLGDVPVVLQHAKKVRSEGMGLIGMKLIGEGAFSNSREDRQAAMKFAFQNAGVNAVTVGFKNTAEIDEAIENLNLALKA